MIYDKLMAPISDDVWMQEPFLKKTNVLLMIFVLWMVGCEKTPPPIQVGVLHSLTGTMSISEQAVVQATLLAIDDINAHGGLLGRKVEAVVADGASQPAIFAHQAKHLIVDAHVKVVFGCWTSASRKSVRPVFEKYGNLLFYPVQYEGLEQSPNIMYTGATPNQQIFPAVYWSLKHLGTRVYLIGSDYVFPRVANWLIRKQLQLFHGEVVGERYIPLGSQDMASIVADIQRFKPDVILNTINGDSNIAFFHALKAAGIKPEDMPVMSFSMGETELRSFQGDAVGHYASWNYFQSIDNATNHAFIKAYQTKFGSQLPVSDPMEAAWVGVHLWANAVRSAHTTRLDVIRTTIVQQSLLAAEGVVSIDEKTQHLWKTARIGRIDSHNQFEILWTSAKPLRPYPYPALISKSEADQFLHKLYDGWDGHWEAPLKSPTHHVAHVGEAHE